MKTSQIDLEDGVHEKMKQLVWEKRLTIKNFIIEAVHEKIEREFNDLKKAGE